MKNLPKLRKSLPLLALFVGACFFSGCKSTEEPKNQSSRPWNQPKGWESGVPGFLQNDRRY